LVISLPNILFRIDHQQIFSGNANKPVAQRFGQILDSERSAVILSFQGTKGIAYIVEKRSLKDPQFYGVRFHFGIAAAEDLFAQLAYRLAQRNQVGGQAWVSRPDFIVSGAEVPVE